MSKDKPLRWGGRRHQIVVHERSATADRILNDGPEVRRTYEVLRPIFKRGREWEVGESIDLHPVTGQAFVETGDVKEIDQ